MGMSIRLQWLKNGAHQPAYNGQPEQWTQFLPSDCGGSCDDLWGCRLPWQQFDTWADAPFFGVFTNNKDLQVVTCAEGDWKLQQCADQAEYNRLIDELCEFHEPGQILTAIGPGSCVTARQDRGCHYSPPKEGVPTASEQIHAAFTDATGGSSK